MKKKIFFTGSVFQFYVPEIKKYAFCKYFDFTHLSEFHGLLAQVFNYFSDTEINSIDDLKKADWLFGPKSMHKWPNLRKDTRWKSLGILSAPEDEIVPDFKGAQPYPNIVENEASLSHWYVIRNFTGGEYLEYEKVKHLEHIVLTTTLGLVWRTGMEYCRINGLKIEDHYDLTDAGIRSTYWQMINVPIYKEIPKDIRGKALNDNHLDGNKSYIKTSPPNTASLIFLFAGLKGKHSDADIDMLFERLKRKFKENGIAIQLNKKNELIYTVFENVRYYISFLKKKIELKDWNKLGEDAGVTFDKEYTSRDKLFRQYNGLSNSPNNPYQKIHFTIGLAIFEEMGRFKEVDIYTGLGNNTVSVSLDSEN